jgi:hypothetical protein
MWVDVIPATNWALGWLIFCLLGFYLAWPVSRHLAAKGVSHLGWALGVALVARLTPIILLPVGAGYDIDSFELVGRALLAGEDVYTSAAVGRHPYLPMQMYAIGAAMLAADWSGLPFVVWIKLPGLFADLGIVALIVCAARRRVAGTDAFYLGLLYALNPVSLLVTAYHGQFDAIAVCLLLLSWYFYYFQAHTYAAITLGFAILNKTWPVVFLPILFIRLQGWRNRIFSTALALAVPVVFTVFYIWLFEANPTPMLRRALNHSCNPGFWGYSAILYFAAQHYDWFELVYAALVSVQRPLMFGVGLLALWLTRKQDALNALITVILLEFAFVVGMGIQWMLWVVPFAILADDLRWLKIFSFTASIFLLGQLYGLHLYSWAYEWWGHEKGVLFIRLVSIPAWITVVLWAVSRLRNR